MAYNATIPKPTDQLNVSQADILNNFAAISTLINVNHVDFNTADQGKHKFVTFPEQTVTPITGIDEVILYSHISTDTNQTELVFVRENNGTAIEITAADPNATGWTFLPSGILMKWGTGLNATGGLQTFMYPASGTTPVFNNVFSLMITIDQAGGTDVGATIYVSDISNPAQFDISSWDRVIVSTPSPCFFSYVAIGD